MQQAKRVEYFITSKCTNRCVFCSESWRFDNKEKSLAQIKKVLLKEKKNGIELVHLLGGEPTLHPQCLQILRWIRQQGLRTYMMTNGVPLADEGFAEALMPWIDEICVSLHGPNKEIHDRLTRKPGSFASLIKTLENARRFHPQGLAADTTLTRQNLKHLKGISGILKRYKISRWSIIAVIPSGLGQTNFERVIPRLSEARKTLPSFLDDAARQGLFPMIAGLPLCALGRKYFPHSFDYRADIAVKGTAARHSGKLRLWLEPGEKNFKIDIGRTKPARCASCAEKNECGGVYQLYHEMFGDEELTPFKVKS